MKKALFMVVVLAMVGCGEEGAKSTLTFKALDSFWEDKTAGVLLNLTKAHHFDEDAWLSFLLPDDTVCRFFVEMHGDLSKGGGYLTGEDGLPEPCKEYEGAFGYTTNGNMLAFCPIDHECWTMY